MAEWAFMQSIWLEVAIYVYTHLPEFYVNNVAEKLGKFRESGKKGLVEWMLKWKRRHKRICCPYNGIMGGVVSASIAAMRVACAVGLTKKDTFELLGVYAAVLAVAWGAMLAIGLDTPGKKINLALAITVTVISIYQLRTEGAGALSIGGDAFDNIRNRDRERLSERSSDCRGIKRVKMDLFLTFMPLLKMCYSVSSLLVLLVGFPVTGFAMKAVIGIDPQNLSKCDYSRNATAAAIRSNDTYYILYLTSLAVELAAELVDIARMCWKSECLGGWSLNENAKCAADDASDDIESATTSSVTGEDSPTDLESTCGD